MPPWPTSASVLATAEELTRAAREVLRVHPDLPLPGDGNTLGRWRVLAAIAGIDVCLIKLLEAHYDALAILAELDAPAPPAGQLLAVWAAEPPQARLEFAAVHDQGGQLSGRKAWCSGAALVDQALVTAYAGAQRQLVQVAMSTPGLQREDEVWQAVGMGRLVSGELDFDAVPAQAVGAPGAYLSRPGFWHGGAGIASCWYGAAAAIGETLRRAPRTLDNPHAAAHLGAVDVALASARAMLKDAAALIDAQPQQAHAASVQRLRARMEQVAGEVIDRVGRALGPGPLCQDRAHAQRCADLNVFIRQSHAERDWAALAPATAEADHPWRL